MGNTPKDDAEPLSAALREVAHVGRKLEHARQHLRRIHGSTPQGSPVSDAAAAAMLEVGVAVGALAALAAHVCDAREEQSKARKKRPLEIATVAAVAAVAGEVWRAQVSPNAGAGAAPASAPAGAEPPGDFGELDRLLRRALACAAELARTEKPECGGRLAARLADALERMLFEPRADEAALERHNLNAIERVVRQAHTDVIVAEEQNRLARVEVLQLRSGDAGNEKLCAVQKALHSMQSLHQVVAEALGRLLDSLCKAVNEGVPAALHQEVKP